MKVPLGFTMILLCLWAIPFLVSSCGNDSKDTSNLGNAIDQVYHEHGCDKSDHDACTATVCSMIDEFDSELDEEEVVRLIDMYFQDYIICLEEYLTCLEDACPDEEHMDEGEMKACKSPYESCMEDASITTYTSAA